MALSRTEDAPLLQLLAVRRSFPRPGGGTIPVLNLDRLVLQRGEQLVISGPNGAGKTTLLHVIAGLLRPDEGRVHVGGVDLGALSEAELDRFRARNIGYLLQGAPLADCLTAEENVMAAMLFGGCPRREHRPRAQRLLERFAVSHRARHLPHALSGGERQRVALARALANEPPLLLADEPLASLDPASASWLLRELEALNAERGMTVVVVSHQPERLPAAAQRLRLTPATGEEGP